MKMLIEPDEKILDASSLRTLMDKTEGTFVFTNGCFDLLHAGHVSYLNQARAEGDYLILGLNSDASVKRLKGDKRPLVSFEDRAFILAGLSCIDFVVGFEEDTPVSLLEKLRPHIHVKGGDYNIEELPETPVIRGYGGEVRILPFLEGRSTTDIVKIIQERYCS